MKKARRGASRARFLGLIAAILLAAQLTSCGTAGKAYQPKPKIEGSTLYVHRVENLPDDFILGMDASCVPSLEKSGVTYRDFDGAEKDVYAILAENGINMIRVRIWNDPYDGEGNGFGGGNCDLSNAVEIGKRATAAGMRLLVNFHYSDFWADPGKQAAPREWQGLEIEDKAERLYQYTRAVLKTLRSEGIAVGMVQIGNETNGSFCGEKIWFRMQQLFSAGSRACREIFPDARVALHFANPEKKTNYEEYAKKLAYYDVDYDVFASSYYPYWHGTLDNLAEVLSGIADLYGKEVMVMETSYAYTTEDSDFYGNTVSDGTQVRPYPFTVQGQANEVRDVVDTIANRTQNGIGVVYWEGTWISVGGASYEENRDLWETCGSGWATSYAAAYDPDDAGRYYGGCAVDNQAFFAPDGTPLESLRVFNLVRYGNEVPLKVDDLADAQVTIDLNDEIVLPETVDSVMNDGSRQQTPVEWDLTEEERARMSAGGVAKYTVTGRADGRVARCLVSMVEFDYLTNGGFETGTDEGWTLVSRKDSDELYVEDKVTDSRTGTRHYHFWSAAKDSVDFDLEQDVTGLRAGTYKYSVSIMGGDAGQSEIYAYVRINGEERERAPLTITFYQEWDTATIRSIQVEEGDTLTVGIHVVCSGEGNGAWGKIDDAMLNSDAP